LDRNNSHDEKFPKQINLREKIMSQQETGEIREYYGTFILYKIKANPVDYID